MEPEIIKSDNGPAGRSGLDKRETAILDGFIKAVKVMTERDVRDIMDHCRRTARSAQVIASQLMLPTADIRNIVSASMMHEVVNVETPRLLEVSAAERCRRIKTIYVQRLDLLAAVPDLHEAALIIRYQHEKYDGSGFFDGLSGEAIPVGSRILAVANAYDEIVAGLRPGVRSTNAEAAKFLKAGSGSAYDGRIVDVLLGSRDHPDRSEAAGFTYQVERPTVPTV